MNSIIILCIAVSFFGALFRMFITTVGNETLSKAFKAVLYVALIITVFNAGGKEKYDFTTDFDDKTDYYSEISDRTVREICDSAEKTLALSVAQDIESNFSALSSCTVELDAETLTVKRIEIHITLKQFLISSYEVKNFISNKYGAETEVIIS